MRKICALFSMLGFVAVLNGCGEPPKPTPGQQLDKAIEKTGDAVKDAGQKIKDAGN